MRKLFTILMCFLVVPILYGQGFENFDNFTATGSSYQTGTFLGQDGSEWSYTQCRGDVGITDKAIMIGRNRTPQSNFYSGTIPNGIGVLNFDYMQAFSSNVNLNVLVNDVVVGNVTSSGEQNIIKNSSDIAIDVEGDFVIKFINVNNGDGQVVVDNVSWTAFGDVQNAATPYFSLPGGTYVDPIELEIFSNTEEATIYYTTDGTDPDDTSTEYTGPITISETTTIKAIAYADGLNPSNIATATYTFPQTIEIENIAALRAAFTGKNDTYILTGEAWLTFQQSFRGQKYIQDATGAILIDDPAGNMTTVYEIGDGITGIAGTLSEYGGMLQFVPIADPGAATSSGNFPEPEVVTIGQLNADFEAYESKLVKILSATFADGGATFNTGQVYAFSDASDAEGNFRTTFYDADYIGTDIPLVPVDIVGLPNSRTDGEYLTARSLADFTENVVDPEIILLSPNGGEIWEKGKTYTINWQNLGFSGNVNINLIRTFTNTPLATDIENTGSYIWTIPESFASADDCRIRVSWVDDNNLNDVSDEVFTITDPLPDPDIVINEIMYNPNQGLDDYYEYLELYNNSGFTVDLSGWYFAQGFDFTFPAGTVMDDASYLVVARVPDTIATFYGISNIVGPFSGALSNGGEIVELVNSEGQQMDIVEYDDGGAWPSEPDGDGPSLELISPDLDNNLPESWLGSIAEFGTPGELNSVSGVEILTLEFPNGGETFEQGTTQDILWSSVGFAGNIKIEVIDTALEITTLLAENVDVSLQTWTWEIPSDFQIGENYIVRITDMDDGDPMDESDAVFTILEVIIPTITVETPNGGEEYAQGTTHEITWTAEFFEGDVMIELSDGLRAVTLIEDNIPATAGSYFWDIPSDQPVGSSYTIIISGMEDGDPSDESDAPFSIIEPEPLPDIIINEIMYNTPGVDNEWCELYNRGDEVVDLEGFYLLDDNDAATPMVISAGYSIAPGQYFTISLELLQPPLFFEPDFVGNPAWSLGNGGDALRLFHPSGQLVNGVYYDDGGEWPSAPDGSGPSLSLLDTSLDNSLAENWAASTQDYGTPGAVNFPDEPTLNLESPNGGETIAQETSFNITWNYANYEGTVMIELLTAAEAQETLGYAAVADMAFTWEVTQDAGENYLIKISDSLTGNPMDESDAVFAITPPLELPDIVINEIMYNAPESGTDSLEFIEFYNNSDFAVNLQNWYLSEGVDFVFPDIELLPGEYLVIAVNANAVFDAFGVDALQWAGGALGNGGEDIELRNADGEVVDYVDYDDAAPWPVAPDEYGPSLALKDPSLDNSLAANWLPETTFAFDHPAGIPVYATPGAANFATPGQGILIANGWGGVSTYIAPTIPQVAEIIAPIVDDVTVMQNFNEIFFPFYNINTIGNWNNNVGYKIKTDATRYLVVNGEPVAGKTVNLPNGWSGMPVLSECAVDLLSLIGGNPAIIFVKEMDSDKVYWPGGGVQTLMELVPGKAYFIKVDGEVNITFPDCE
jgi:hypothetical protein